MMAKLNNDEMKDQLLDLVRSTVKCDHDLRNKYQIGDKFRFIHDRLVALQARVEEGIKSINEQRLQKNLALMEDEVLVYVYLFNSQGMTFKSWEKLLRPNVFYEYSVNRPIYQDQALIDAFIRTKENKNQHAYMTVAVKKTDILTSAEAPKDLMGSPLIKVREGSLKIEKLMSFNFDAEIYKLASDGTLEKKS